MALGVSIKNQYSFIPNGTGYENYEPLNESQISILRNLRSNCYECTASRTAAFVMENPDKIARAFVPNCDAAVTLFAISVPNSFWSSCYCTLTDWASWCFSYCRRGFSLLVWSCDYPKTSANSQ